MPDVYSLPADRRPSALYLIAHQGPLREPHCVDLQHMRIRRYMHLLSEFKRVDHHYDEDADIYVEFAFRTPTQFPTLMRLGEAIAKGRYKSLFVDLPHTTHFSGVAPRERFLSEVSDILSRLPLEVIDVSRDPEHVLEARLAKSFGEIGTNFSSEFNQGQDYVAFFPASAAAIAEAVFEMELNGEDRMKEAAVAEAIRHRVDWIKRQNPYSQGDPWISEPLYSNLVDERLKRRREQVELRRASGETLYSFEPGGKPLLRDEDVLQHEARTLDSFARAELRVAELGFERVADGQIVSYQRDFSEFKLFADHRAEGKIVVRVFRRKPLKGNRKKQSYDRLYPDLSIQDGWWKTDAKVRLEALLEKTAGAHWKPKPLASTAK